jgi:hypothetical protein
MKEKEEEVGVLIVVLKMWSIPVPVRNTKAPFKLASVWRVI